MAGKFGGKKRKICFVLDVNEEVNARR